jgi:hypothetical protein
MRQCEAGQAGDGPGGPLRIRFGREAKVAIGLPDAVFRRHPVRPVRRA